MVFIKPLITQKDLLPFNFVSENTLASKIAGHIISAQNENLSEVLQQDLFQDFMTVYHKEIKITALQEANANVGICYFSMDITNDLQVGSYIYFSNVTGDFADIVNGKQFKVSAIIAVDTIEFEVDVLLATSTSGQGGKVEKIFTPEYFELYKNIVPMLAYMTYLRYIPKSNQHETPYGYRIKKEDYSEPVPSAQIGIDMRATKDSINFWKKKLVEYLENNYINFPFYKPNTNESPKFENSTLPIYPKNKRLFGTVKRKN